MLCRDARDGHDKLSLEARKLSLEGARRRWEGSIALTLALQTPSTLSIPSTLPSSLSVSTATSTPIVADVLKEGVDSSALVAVKIEKLSAEGVTDTKLAQLTDSSAQVAIKNEAETSTSSSTKIGNSNSSGFSHGVSSDTHTVYPYPPIPMKLEDMPVSACRIVNPFSNGNRGAWDWLTATYQPPAATPATDSAPSSSSPTSSSSSSSSYRPPTSSPTAPAINIQDPRTYNKQSLYSTDYENNLSTSSDPSRARCRAYADTLIQASGSNTCFDHCVRRATGLLKMDLNAIIIDECLGKSWSLYLACLYVTLK